MRGRELSEAKEWSQTKVNSIRPIAEGELAEKQHLPEATPGGVGEAWVPRARPTGGTARVESWIVGSAGVFGVGTFEGDMG